MPFFKIPMSLFQLTRLHTLIFFILFINFNSANSYNTRSTSVSSSKIPSVPYSSTECASIIPEATPSTHARFSVPYLNPSNSYYIGGNGIFGMNSSQNHDNTLIFHTHHMSLATDTKGVYKIEVLLTFRMYNMQHNSSYGTLNHRLAFKLHGFWSESLGKGCMVGSASWYSSKGDIINIDAMLKLKCPKNSTISTSSVSGKLESLKSPNDEDYFEPIIILAFPDLSDYEYKLVLEDIFHGLPAGIDIPQHSLSVKGRETYSMFSGPYKLEYASECESLQNCTPLDVSVGYMPTFISLITIQCSSSGNNQRFLIKFSNGSHEGNAYDIAFNPKTTLIGEGLWDENRNQLFIVACQILNSADSLDNARVDCSIRLNLWSDALFSIRNITRGQGQIWTNKSATEVGYFEKIKFRNFDDYMLRISGVKYEYTESDRVRMVCPKKRVKKGGTYPTAHSYDMRLDLSIGTSKGRLGWGYADPIFVGHELYDRAHLIDLTTRTEEFKEVDQPKVEFENSPLGVTSNVTYKLRLLPGHVFKLGSLNLSLNSKGMIEIFAEGVYDAATGSLCMVGCRNVGSRTWASATDSLDCEILVELQFLGSKTKNGGLTKGSIKSLRRRSDPLFFQLMSITSSAYAVAEAKRSIWRIDLEITMVLISNTLACVFVLFQLYHVKRYSNGLPHISLIMLVILTLGHTIPLVLNFEALFLKNRYRQNILLGSSGWLELNEVIVRVVTMIAFLLQLRLLQLTWSARLGESKAEGVWAAEKKALFVTLPLYILGALISVLVNREKHNYRNVWNLSSHDISYHQRPMQHSLGLLGDLRSYAGLVLDCFLFPQVLLNILQMSTESSLSIPFYLGTSLIRLVPHAYDLYRAYNYVPAHVNGTYYYAKPGADFYSIAWDVFILFVGLLFAGIIYLQQKYGGRFMLPSRYREFKLYSKLPVVST